jgi:hypothetical protein
MGMLAIGAGGLNKASATTCPKSKKSILLESGLINLLQQKTELQ